MAITALESTTNLKQLMRRYFMSLDACKESGRKVAWCTSVGPAELLRALGFEVYFPENHGALLGTSRTAGEYISASVQRGYAGDICSYLTSDIGAFLEHKTPLTQQYGIAGVPHPDILVYNTNQCRDVQEWFSFYARSLHVPIVGVTPPRHLNYVTSEHVANIAAQFEAMIPVLEKVSGNTFDIDRFREVVRLSREASHLWRRVLETATASPAPLDFFDGCIHMGPIVVLRGTEEAVVYYAKLLDELSGYMRAGIGVADQEMVRIYWDGMPIWGRLRALSNLFRRHGASIVASTYCNSWIFDQMDERIPFESTARAYAEIFINRSEEVKQQLLTDIVNQFSVDGIIFHDARTCPNNSNSRYGMPQRVMQDSGIRTLTIEGDLCDLRFYSEGQTITKIEAFLEQLVEVRLQRGSERMKIEHLQPT